MSKLIGGLFLLSLIWFFEGAGVAYKGWKNPEPTRITVADYVNSDKSKEWVVLTDAKINLLDAVTVTRKEDGELSTLYIPIKFAGFTQDDTVNLLLETNDKEILDVARQLKTMSEAMSEAELLQSLVRERDKLIRSVELSGVMKKGEEWEILKHIKNLNSEFYILEHNSSLSLKQGLSKMGAGLVMLIISSFFIYLYSCLKRGIEETAAAQARTQEIKARKEAYKLSKSKTRAASYDSQGQAAKSPIPHSPSIIIPPQRNDVVVEQNSVSLPNRDNSQVSPHRSPPDYYKILGISHAADLQEINSAAQTKANEIKTAFTVLSQAETRLAYNANLSYTETRTAYDAKLKHNHYDTLAVSREANLAQIEVATQARMNEIKEAYENLSKPETRATYDSQWQSVKPSTSIAPSPQKRENVVVEPKPVSPSDRDKSQVPPQQSSSVSLTDATRHTTEIKRAKSGTRFRAVMVDAFTVVVPIIFWAFFSSFLSQKLVSVEMADIYVRLSELILIGVIMINLVLLYRHGQTIGRRLLAIKIVDEDGSRAELSRILCEFWSVKLLLMMLLLIMLYPIIVMLYPIIGAMMAIIILMLSNSLSRRLVTASLSSIPLAAAARFILYVIQNLLCLHHNFVHTIEVRVSPGNNDTPYGSLTGVIGTSTLMAVMFCLAAWGMINAHTDFLKRNKVSEAIEWLGGLKTPAEEYLAAKGEFPSTSTIELLTKKTSAKYVASLVSNPKEFYFEATMSWEDRGLAGKTVRLIYDPNKKTWSCSAASPNGIPQEYLPSSCK